MRGLVTLAAALLLAAAQPALAAWHDEFPGSAGRDAVHVHRVSLAGHGGDNEVNLRHLIELREACVRLNATMGRPSAALPPGGYPKTVRLINMDIYYASNRTLEVLTSRIYDVDVTDCAVRRNDFNSHTLYSRAGICTMDMNRKTARGHCDAAAHARAVPLQARQRPVSVAGAMAGEGLAEKAPPQYRKQVAAALPAPPSSAQSGAGASTANNEFQSIAGVQCRVYRDDAPGISMERCMAQPTPQSVAGLNPYPIPPAPLNGMYPGILLALKGSIMTVTAEQLELNLPVSPNLFEVPAGFKLHSIPLPSR